MWCTCVYEGFQTPFFPINLSPDFGYEAPRRGPLLLPVIHSVQRSPTPSSSTSRTLWACCWKLRYEIKNSENAERATIRYVLTEVVAGTKNKTLHHCLQKRFISVKTRLKLSRVASCATGKWAQNIRSVPMFLDLSDRPIKKFALVRPPHPPGSSF